MNPLLPVVVQADGSAASPKGSLVRKLLRTCLLPMVLATWVSLLAIPCRGQDPAMVDPALAAMNHKLANIIVPEVDFRSTTISEAVDFLRDEANRHDLFPDSGPTGRGVNMVIIWRRGFNPRSEPGRRITLNLKQTPLLEALRQSAEQVGMTVLVQPYDIWIIPAQPGAFGDTATLVHITLDSPEAEAILHKLEGTIVPHVEFRDNGLGEPVDYLNQPIAALNGGVHFAISQANPPKRNGRRTWLMVEKIPLLELLRIICLQCDVRMRITPQGVEFESAQTEG